MDNPNEQVRMAVVLEPGVVATAISHSSRGVIGSLPLYTAMRANRTQLDNNQLTLYRGKNAGTAWFTRPAQRT